MKNIHCRYLSNVQVCFGCSRFFFFNSSFVVTSSYVEHLLTVIGWEIFSVGYVLKLKHHQTGINPWMNSSRLIRWQFLFHIQTRATILIALLFLFSIYLFVTSLSGRWRNTTTFCHRLFDLWQKLFHGKETVDISVYEIQYTPVLELQYCSVRIWQMIFELIELRLSSLRITSARTSVKFLKICNLQNE